MCNESAASRAANRRDVNPTYVVGQEESSRFGAHSRDFDAHAGEGAHHLKEDPRNRIMVREDSEDEI